MAYPDAVKVKDNNGWLAFHLVLRNYLHADERHAGYQFGVKDYQCYMTIAKMVFKFYPAVAQIKVTSTVYDKQKSESLPQTTFHCEQKSESLLHMVCRGGNTNHSIYFDAQTNMVLFLLKQDPHGLFEEEDGKTPLEVIPGDSEGMMKKLQRKLKTSNTLFHLLSTLRDNRNGNNIIHILSNNILRTMLGLFPNLIMETNANGDLPMHVRLMHNGKQEHLLEDMKALVTTYDKMCSKKSSNEKHNDNNDDLVNDFDCPSIGTKRDCPFVTAATRKKPCTSTTYFLLQRHVGVRGGLPSESSGLQVSYAMTNHKK